MDLPTYTNIWRIEKRLYKLYDFRLPMPLPVGQIAVFTAIAVPYVVVLSVLGLPFSHTLLWLYVLPPGLLAWLATRPVLESKRLPELIVSQLRYLGEPRSWCRMAPFAEKDEITLVAKVWRRVGAEEDGQQEMAVAAALTRLPAVPDGSQAGPARQIPAAWRVPRRQAAALARPAGARPRQASPARHAARSGQPQVPALPAPSRAAAPVDQRPAAAVAVAGPPPAPAAGPPRAPAAPPALAVGPPRAPAAGPPPAPPAPRRPLVIVTHEQSGERPLRLVERALNDPAERRAEGWRDQVVVVPGGHRPGQPDQLQRDRARARLPVTGSCRIVVLGCTVGAGQTMTTLMTGELLASLRDDPVAVLDLNPGDGSLWQRARELPELAGGGPVIGPVGAGQVAPAPSRLEVVTSQASEAGGAAADADVTRIFELLSARYALTLADPAAAAVPGVLTIADQLILVAPASRDASGAIAMTREWLEAHGHAELADGAIIVLNGVSGQTAPYVERAEAVVRGRCRAIVRVPWDDRLKNQEAKRPAAASPAAAAHRPSAGLLSPSAARAFTALAGAVVGGLSGPGAHGAVGGQAAPDRPIASWPGTPR